MKYTNKTFSVGMPRVTQEQWDAIFKKKRHARRERQPDCRRFRCLAGGECPKCDDRPKE